MKFPWLLLLVLAWPALPVAASSLALANAKTYYVDFSSAATIEGCETRLMLALQKHLIKTVQRPDQADARYRVQIQIGSGSRFRQKLSWVGDVYSADKQLLLSVAGEESGWSLQGACIDAAEDIAEALGEEVKAARVHRADLPLPAYPERYQPKAGLVTGSEAPVDPDYRIQERAIRAQEGPEHVSLRWQTHARSFARTRGCSEQLEHVQSLATGTETYTTVCGQSGEVLITCLDAECILSF